MCSALMPLLVAFLIPSSACPEAWKLYGLQAGGFCCDRNVAGDSTCDGGICAVAGNSNTQGFPYCSSTLDHCPSGSKPYGSWAGGFCCTGTLNTQAGYPSGCTGSICALDATRTQGNPVCTQGEYHGRRQRDMQHIRNIWCSLWFSLCKCREGPWV